MICVCSRGVSIGKVAARRPESQAVAELYVGAESRVVPES